MSYLHTFWKKLTILCGLALWAGIGTSVATANPSAGPATPVEVEPIVVVPSDRFGTLNEEPSNATDTILASEIIEIGATNLPDALRGRLGIWVQQTGPGQGSPIIRGLIGSEVLTLVDGFRVNSALTRNAPNQYFSLVDVHSADRIEIVRGGGSVLYGSDAVGGVVNLIRNVPIFYGDEWDYRGWVMGRFETGDLSQTNRVALSFGNQSIGVGGGLTVERHNNLVTGGASQMLDPTEWSGSAGDFAATFVIGEQRVTISAEGQHIASLPRWDEMNIGINGEPPERAEFFYEPSARLSIRARWELENRVDRIKEASVTAGWQRLVDGRRLRDHESAVRVTEFSTSDLLGIVGRLRISAASWADVVLGVDLYHDAVGSETTETDLNTNQRKKKTPRFANCSVHATAGLYGHSYFQVGPWLDVNVGARVSYSHVNIPNPESDLSYSLHLPDLTGEAGFAIYLTDPLLLVANVSRAYRIPTSFDLSQVGKRPNGRFNIPNSELRPEHAISSDIGIDLWLSQIQIKIVGFGIWFQDKIESIETGGVTEEGLVIVQNANVGHARHFGIEASAGAWPTAWMELLSNITYTYGEVDQPKGVVESANRIPPLNGGLGVRLNSADYRLWFLADMRFALAQRRLGLTDRNDRRIDRRGTPEWITVNLLVGWRPFKMTEIRLGVQNIANTRYREHGSGSDAVGINATVTVDCAF